MKPFVSIFNIINQMIRKHKKFKLILFLIVLLFTVGLLLMQYSGVIIWTSFDFLLAGLFFCFSMVTFYFISIKIVNIKYKYPVYSLLFILLILLWIEISVGIFNTSITGN